MDWTLVSWPLAIFAGLLLADFASGAIHWIIDRYCDPDVPLAGTHFVGLIHEHHRRPHAMFALNWFVNNGGFFTIVGGFFVMFALLGWINLVTGSAFAFGALANQIHMWAHKRPRFGANAVRALQRVGLLQSSRHHGVHHGPDPMMHYCLITNYVNPVVDRLRLWRRGEWVVERLLGVTPKYYVLPNPEFRLI